MLVALLAALGGLVVGLLGRGRARRRGPARRPLSDVGHSDVGLADVGLSDVGLSGPGLLDLGLADVGLLAVAAAGEWLAWAGPAARSPAVALAVLAVGALAAAAFLVRNRTLRGVGLVGLGLAANLAVIAANGAMPVSGGAARSAGVSPADLARSAGHQLAGPGTTLGWLGDVVPVRLPAAPEVLSPGDVCVAAGIGLLVASALLTVARGGPEAGVGAGVGASEHGEEEAQASGPGQERGQSR